MFAATAFALAFAGAPALAQSAPEPAAIERTIPQQLPQQTTLPTISAPAREMSARSIGARRFTLGAVDIEGAKTFSRAELSRYFEPYLASQVDQSKLREVASRITDHYRQNGYLLSYAVIPAQNVQSGIVRIAVVEGRIEKVTVKGAGPEEAAIETITAPLLRGAPLRSATLERAIGLLRDFPGLKVIDVSLLRTDAEAGLYALNITVKRDRIRAFTYSDNRGTNSVGKMRIYSSASISSLAMQGDELRLDLFAMPGKRFNYRYGQLLASVPVGRNGMRVAVAVSKGDQYLLGGGRFDADSRNISAQLSYPMLRGRALTLLGHVSINDWQSLGDQNRTRRLRDRLRVVRMGVEFATESKTRVQGDFTLSRGLGFDGMTRVGDALASRPDASGRFTKAVLTFQLTRPLSEALSMKTVVAGQYSDRPLLSVEEFALGGNRIGRAFAFNALTGDRGVGGGAELSYRLGGRKDRSAGVELFGFVDGGAVYQAKSTATSQGRHSSLASAGVGSRFRIAGALISVEAGVPIATRGQDRSVRLFFSTYRAF